MHKNIDKIKKLESSPKVKNLFNKNEIRKIFKSLSKIANNCS